MVVDKTKPKKVSCECIDCGYEKTTTKHCKDLKCPDCGGTMRRKSRPGPGQDKEGLKMEKKYNSNEQKDDFIIEEQPIEGEEQIDNMKNGVFTIIIDGEIGWDITAKSITNQLEKADGQDVVFEIASPGGSVFEGVEIFNAIRNYEGKTEAKLLGIAASMASYIPLATDKVFAEDNATYMIHNVWSMAEGDSKELKKQADKLESLTQVMAQEYVKKTGKTEKEILKMMSEETWLYGDEIKEAGFVDEMIVHDKGKEGSGSKTKKSKEDSITEAKLTFKKGLGRVRGKKAKIKGDDIMKKTSKFTNDSVDKIKSITETLKGLAKNKKPNDEVYLKVKDISLLIQDLEEISSVEHDEPEPDTEPTPDEDAKPDEKEDKKTDKKEVDEKGDEVDESSGDDDGEKSDPEPKPDAKPTESETEDDKTTEPDEKKGGGEEKVDGEDVKPDEEVDKSSKFKQLLELCEDYRVEIANKDQIISKMSAELDIFKQNTEGLKKQISKFKAESYDKLLNETVLKVSKFKNLPLDKEIKLKEEYVASKMSETALGEIGRLMDDQMFSKMDKQNGATTIPSEYLNSKAEVNDKADQPQDYSKMSKSEKLTLLAKAQAKARGFVE